MYKNFFGLKENPFNINPDPRYLFLTRRAQEAMGCLTYGVETRKGFIVLSGEVGTGKTTLLNKLLDTLHQQGVATAFIFNPRLTVSQFFDFMLADFNIDVKTRSKSQMLFKLNQWLLDRYRAGERAVLVVDEAQSLSPQVLEEIRLLTNLETSTDKLLQIVLAGQPELERKLRREGLRQVRQRIALRAKTVALSPEETRGYIVERLRIAGWDGEEIFSEAAIETVHRHAQGIPRVTNLLCEHALIRAFVEQCKPVSSEIVDEIARDFDMDENEPSSQAMPPKRSSNGGRRRKQGETSPAPASRRASKANAPDTAAQPDGVPSFGIIQAQVPLFVYGYDAAGAPFYEEAYTIAIGARGGLLSMRTSVARGQRLLITNKENEQSQECVVIFGGAHLARGVDVAFEFASPTSQFWGERETAKAPDVETIPEAPEEQSAAAGLETNVEGEVERLQTGT
jgi:general secretion pathway protein A